jgi:hypothetical protein
MAKYLTNATKHIHHVGHNFYFTVGAITVTVSPLLGGAWGYTLWREDNKRSIDKSLKATYIALEGECNEGWTSEQAIEAGMVAARVRGRP